MARGLAEERADLVEGLAADLGRIAACLLRARAGAHALSLSPLRRGGRLGRWGNRRTQRLAGRPEDAARRLELFGDAP